MQNRYLFRRFAAVFFFLVFTSACATKSYVMQQSQPLSDRLARVETRLDALDKKVADLEAISGQHDTELNDLKAEMANTKADLDNAVSKADSASAAADNAAKRAEQAEAKCERAARKCEKAFELRQRK